jgi:hypothetical protein
MSPDQPFEPCGSTRFEHADQLQFAALTGDFNPMHVDPIAARRLVTGRQVVHGMHVLLRALEHWSMRPAALPTSVSVDFVSPVCVGDAVNFDFQADALGKAMLRANADGHPCTYIEVTTGAIGDAGPSGDESAGPAPLALPRSPVDREPKAWVGESQRIEWPATDMVGEFPQVVQWLGAERVAALGLLSSYVGMVCPGLNSVFTAVTFSPVPATDDKLGLSFKVTRFDPRYRIFLIDFDGCIRGRIKAFVRAAPQEQPSMAALAPLVSAEEFTGTHTWVVGGSRGLGELTAKMVAAGGGDVTLTYAKGQGDAERVVKEINAFGSGRAQARRLDVEGDDIDAWVSTAPLPDTVFYYATPRIFNNRAAAFNWSTFESFNLFYVRRFDDLCMALAQRMGKQRAAIFYPSSVVVTDRPRGLTEYAMSKAAGEVLVEDLNRAASALRITWARLPRLATDQTAAVHAVAHDDNVEVMLPLIRQTFAALG